MDIAYALNIILLIVFSLLGVALILFVIELIKTLKATQNTINDIEPTLKNVEDITTNIQPTLAKVDPLMDRVQLTLDSVNLEMMRVDQILEDVSEITDIASSTTAAVDSITNAPLKAVNSVAARVKSALGGRDASDESALLAEQRVAVAQALQDYKSETEKNTNKADKSEDVIANKSTDGSSKQATKPDFVSNAPKSYVQLEEDGELVIDPNVIAESPFFDTETDAK